MHLWQQWFGRKKYRRLAAWAVDASWRRYENFVARGLGIPHAAVHRGQIDMNLKWLDKHKRELDEEVAMDLILCARSAANLWSGCKGITTATTWASNGLNW